MKKIILKKDLGYIYLISSFYEESAILKAFEIYSEFIEFSKANIGKYIVIKLKNKSEEFEIKLLSKEFLNYLIALQYK